MGVSEDLSITPAVSTVIGGLSGVIEVLIQQPLVTWKNFVQDSRPVPLDLRILYRGVFVNAASIAPINGIQFGANNFLEKAFAVNGELSDGARAGVATTAGAISGLVTCPAELLMIQQQKWGGTLTGQLGDVVRQHGIMALNRAMGPTIVREAIFTGAYLGVLPIMREKMESAWPEIFVERPMASMVTASVAAGVGASLATQPFDTVKTRMQANLGDAAYRTMRSTAASMWQEGTGIRPFFKGIIPRAQRVTFAVFILGEAHERLTELYLRFRPKTSHSLALALEKQDA